MTLWLQVIAGLLGLAALWYKQYLQDAPARKQGARNEEINQGRQDIADGNAAAVSARIDSVCGKAAGDTPVLGNDEDTARRLNNITGQ